jgi:hypothetical protein
MVAVKMREAVEAIEMAALTVKTVATLRVAATVEVT